MPTVETIERVAASQFVWAILCIAILVVAYFAVKAFISRMQIEAKEEKHALQAESKEREEAIRRLYETQREESKVREERLMSHLEKTTRTLDAISTNLTDLQRQVNNGFEDVWTHLKRRE